ncbi:MAG TPA: class I SAM-dependent methyltransferase [Caldithrix abyssi]|uniref:Class I SAM-dependent methyltransferase n=1 Tax=Caldithrix abyssi TaxID=187145 RepID=A0A7V4U2L4_CALAY|nr:class I SAM-dependent methyltransferase [Caldithrix abyssi]
MNDQQPVSSFLSILHTWPEYFETQDEGLGTTYERFILHRYFEWLKKEYAVNSLLEVPAFGMTGLSGINSLWWAKNGVTPVVVDNHEQRVKLAARVWQNLKLDVEFRTVESYYPLPFKDQTFDMGWNFASLWFIADLPLFLEELNRLVKKVLFICVPNSHGIGYKLREWFNKEPIADFYPQNILPKNFVRPLAKLGWQVRKKGYLDIPPWPDIAMKKEDLFKKMGLGFLAKNKSRQGNAERTCIVDYFSGKNPNLEKDILKYDFLEKAPFPVKQLWGHHRYFIFEKKS